MLHPSTGFRLAIDGMHKKSRPPSGVECEASMFLPRPMARSQRGYRLGGNLWVPFTMTALLDHLCK